MERAMFEKDNDHSNSVLKYKTQLVALSEKISEVTSLMNMTRDKTDSLEQTLREKDQQLGIIESKNKYLQKELEIANTENAEFHRRINYLEKKYIDTNFVFKTNRPESKDDPKSKSISIESKQIMIEEKPIVAPKSLESTENKYSDTTQKLREDAPSVDFRQEELIRQKRMERDQEFNRLCKLNASKSSKILKPRSTNERVQSVQPPLPESLIPTHSNLEKMSLKYIPPRPTGA